MLEQQNSEIDKSNKRFEAFISVIIISIFFRITSLGVYAKIMK